MSKFRKKPCPHCGSKNLRFERWVDLDGVAGRPNTVLYQVFCAACSYSADHWEVIPDEAIKYWNTRPIEAALSTTVAEEEEQIYALTAETARLKTENTRLTQTVSALTVQIVFFSDLWTPMSNEIKRLTAALTTAQAEIGELKAEVKALKTDPGDAK